MSISTLCRVYYNTCIIWSGLIELRIDFGGKYTAISYSGTELPDLMVAYAPRWCPFTEILLMNCFESEQSVWCLWLAEEHHLQCISMFCAVIVLLFLFIFLSLFYLYPSDEDSIVLSSYLQPIINLLYLERTTGKICYILVFTCLKDFSSWKVRLLDIINCQKASFVSSNHSTYVILPP